MTSKAPSRRAFLLSTLVAAPSLGRARASHRHETGESESEPVRGGDRDRDRERDRERERLVELAETYGSELGSLRKVGR